MKPTAERRFIPSYALSFTAFAVVTPYLSIMVRDMGYSPVWVGILLGVFEGSAIAGPFVFGYWADKTGNFRPAIIVTYILSALVAIPMVRWIHPAVSAVLLAALAFGFRSTASLLDAITTIQIGKSGDYGKIRSWGSISFIIFSLFLQWTPFLKPNSAGNIALWIVLTSLAAIIPIISLPRASLISTEHHTEKSGGEGKGIPLLSIYFIGGFAIIFLCRFAMSSVYTYFPLYLTETLQWNAVGLMFALSSASEVPFMFISAMLLRRFGALTLLAFSAAGITVRLLLWALFPYKAVIIAAQLLHSLCFGIYHPAAVQFISSVFPAKKRGRGMPVYLALGSGLPALIGNMIGGAVVESAGYRPLFAIYAGVAGASVVIFFVMRRKKEEELEGNNTTLFARQ
ncbi:MAG: MFS transporter [Treponema sp.]|jgi:PPP family 3-phenylpropionic acid transporter|nr:MFS transporter [Treponema sp.]